MAEPSPFEHDDEGGEYKGVRVWFQRVSLEGKETWRWGTGNSKEWASGEAQTQAECIEQATFIIDNFWGALGKV